MKVQYNGSFLVIMFSTLYTSFHLTFITALGEETFCILILETGIEVSVIPLWGQRYGADLEMPAHGITAVT
jgi:hypothetical protein